MLVSICVNMFMPIKRQHTKVNQKMECEHMQVILSPVVVWLQPGPQCDCVA